MKALYFAMIFILHFSCRQAEKGKVRLSYDLYKGEILVKRNAVVMDIQALDTANFISLHLDSTVCNYYEKYASDGVYRSMAGSGFVMTHSFLPGNEVTSSVSDKCIPVMNELVSLLRTYKLPDTKKNDVEILLFDEVMPMYSFTTSYFLKDRNVFLAYYDQHKDTYYKLSEVIGLADSKEVLAIANELVNDTTFFGDHYKLPKIDPPPLEK